MISKFVFDTCSYSSLKRGNTTVIDTAETADELYLPSIVIGELLAGFKGGKKELLNTKELDDFIINFNVNIINIDYDVCKKYAIIFNNLKKKGKPIPTNDLWIAASTTSIGGTLMSSDTHFKNIDNLDLLPF